MNSDDILTTDNNENQKEQLYTIISDADLLDLQDRLGYTFKNSDLLYQALTHRSTPADQHTKTGNLAIWHNERLEFLGDAVLELVISTKLYQLYPDAAEGALSHWRSSVVNTRSLSILATKINLGSCLMMGRGEDLSGGRKKVSILGDSFEAILGALFLDGGLSVVEDLLNRLIGDKIDKLQAVEQYKDYKSLLQEQLQSVGRALPSYKVTAVVGPPHQRVFEVSCLLENDLVAGIGSGHSKRYAEQLAAKSVVEQFLEIADPTIGDKLGE
ncbi:MAG: ribonuclease III [Magnetococcales bacterium]|nr:ribonuclease III [Magnetococcales bacterium]